MRRRGSIASAAAALVLATGAYGCGDDEESTEGESASATEVTVTTGDTEDGFSWEVEPTPTADTETISYVNESEQPHALILARINEGYTFEEANELQGRKGSAELIAQSGEKDSPGPGETATIEVTAPIEPGNYAIFCPIPGHAEQGQLEEFEVE
jgi:uncharacterized cupredoxin-like copper-binding protein